MVLVSPQLVKDVQLKPGGAYQGATRHYWSSTRGRRTATGLASLWGCALWYLVEFDSGEELLDLCGVWVFGAYPGALACLMLLGKSLWWSGVVGVW